MRVSREQAQASRRRIVETAAQLFRERGFEGIGVADLMKASGLTHGGFYRHFSSKDDLAAKATDAAYDQLEQDTAGKSIDALLTRYISRAHRDDLASSCPTSALGADAIRQADDVKTVFAKGVTTWIDLIGEALSKEAGMHAADRRAVAIELAARAVGALVLSRATSADQCLSDEILDTCLSASLVQAKGAA